MKPKNALRMVSTSGLSRDEWLEVRRQGVGSSEAAAAVGLNPYQSALELWLDKTGQAGTEEPVPGQDDPRYWGTLLEPFVAEAYQHRTGRKVRRVNAVLQHPTFHYMLANIDREIVGDPEVQILECKTAGEFGARLWRDGVPEYVQLQVQHQLAVTGKQAADVAVLLCGQDLQIHRIERDDEVISRLVVLEAHFWGHVRDRIPPPPDGSESAARALRQLYPGGGDVLDFSENAELSTVYRQLLEARQHLAHAESVEESLKQQLQAAMGDASRALFEGGEVSFKRSKDSVTTDWKALASDYPEIVNRYATTKPGSRRFLLIPNTKSRGDQPC